MKDIIVLTLVTITCLLLSTGCAHTYDARKGYGQFRFGGITKCITTADFSDACALRVVEFIQTQE